MKKNLLIFNPMAAKGKASSYLKIILDTFNAKGLKVDVRESKSKEDAFEQAKLGTLEGYKRIIAVGGDGSVNNIINAIMISTIHWDMQDRPELAVIPLGRGNDFNFSANLPSKFEDSINTIIEGYREKIDVGYLNYDGEERFFLNGIGIGVEPLINHKAQSFKRISGSLSYFFGMLHVLMKYPKVMKLRMSINGSNEYYESQQLSILNGRRMGAMFLLCPFAKIDDGLLNLVWANRRLSRREVLACSIKFFKGKHLKDKRFFNKEIKEVSIESESNDIAIHADGENLTLNAKNLYAKIFEGSIYLIRPRVKVN